jgi:hypothetical protein
MKNFMQKHKYAIAGFISSVVVLAPEFFSHATDTSPLTVNTTFGTFTDSIGTVLTTNLPLVLAIAAGLIGLGILVHYVRRWVGRK